LELALVNELSEAITGKRLFREDYEEDRRPKELTWILVPTYRNFAEFVQALQKIVPDNVDLNFFDSAFRKKHETRTISLLENWLEDNFPKSRSALQESVRALRDLRGVRSKDSHKYVEDVYDPDFTRQQHELIRDVFASVRTIRGVLQTHRAASGVSTDRRLLEDEIRFF
jgi:hypothetical protein